MHWNLQDVNFLYPPDVFVGSFDNDKMQARHELQVAEKLATLQASIKRETDPLLAMKKLHPNDHRQFLINNRTAFQLAERMEEALLIVYSRRNAPFSSEGDTAVWNSLFSHCDRHRLSQLGEPIPSVIGRVYRGSVSGCRKSLSWTPDRQSARRFADRWQGSSMGGGEIYEVDISSSEILIYRHNRGEQEVLLSPQFIETAEIRPFQP